MLICLNHHFSAPQGLRLSLNKMIVNIVLKGEEGKKYACSRSLKTKGKKERLKLRLRQPQKKESAEAVMPGIIFRNLKF